MKAKELLEKSDAELKTLLQASKSVLFKAKIGNHTNQLADTSSIPKSRKEIARVLTEISRRANASKQEGEQA